MVSRFKGLGGVLLIVGTSIGGGMLALPVSTAPVGIFHSIIFLLLCWLVMTCGAFLILEVNLRLPPGSNMISMVKLTLGLPGQIVAWVTYLFLLYALLAAYISGGSDVFHSLLQQAQIDLSNRVTAILFTVVFGFIIYSGIRTVDYVNRGLMFGKLGIYVVLLITIAPHMSLPKLSGGSMYAITGSMMILITSFGFASIVPSLRDYFSDDEALLRRIIIWGSLIPLLCYIAWITVIMGVVARGGDHGLLALMQSDHATSGLTDALSRVVQSRWITGFFAFFTSICMITAFLGVSLGLFDFLADGLSLKKRGLQGKWTFILTFLPPLIMVLFKPGIYLHALNYAGVCCVILLLLLPVLMAWRGRRLLGSNATVMLPGGQVSLVLLGVVAVLLLGAALTY